MTKKQLKKRVKKAEKAISMLIERVSELYVVAYGEDGAELITDVPAHTNKTGLN